MTKKTGIILAGIALILLAALVLFFLNKRAHKQGFTMSTEQLSPSEVPAGLPRDLPMDKGSKVLQNYESQTSDSRRQSTRQITSTKAPKEALDFYIDFFKKNGWEGGVSESADTSGQQVGQMQSKSGGLLTIVATAGAKDQSNIEFTLIQGR